MQDPKKLLAILGKMGQKPDIQFNNLFQKLYNEKLWLLAYQQIAPKAGNMTAGVDGNTIDGTGLKLIRDLIGELKTSSYKPKPAKRTYIPKAKGGQRPLGILSFRDKLLQTAVKILLEAIYKPTFSPASHGFRSNRSCHTVLKAIKRLNGIRYWIEGDIRDYFNRIDHPTMLRILGKRITDQRFLHLIEQFLKAGYLENWQYHHTYSGVAQGGNLSPILSNIYLNEFDQAVMQKIAEFNRGKIRKVHPDYSHQMVLVGLTKKKARASGDWHEYKRQYHQLLNLNPQVSQDPGYRRMFYFRYADDTLCGIIGSKTEAEDLKKWMSHFLETELKLELSKEKTLITHARKRVRFLGYDIKRWKGNRVLRYRTKHGARTQRTGNYHLTLLMPRDKTIAFGKKYGDTSKWRGRHRGELLNLSELEILKIYNAEIRGFLNYYSLADNLTDGANNLLWLTSSSFFRTLAGKRRSTLVKVAKSLKIGRNQYAITLKQAGKEEKCFDLISSTRQLKKDQIDYHQPDLIPNTFRYRTRTELGQRLLARKCEWCGNPISPVEVHHIRKLADLKGKSWWERQMIERKRKTMILCVECHDELHAGKLSEQKKLSREDWYTVPPCQYS